MPAMKRLDGKVTRIAYSILGKPANMQDTKSKKDAYVDKRLQFEETVRVR